MTPHLLSRFREPYPSNFTAASSLRHGLGSGLFVVLFMVVAQPFGLGELAEEIRTVLYAGYGLVTAGAIGVTGLVVPRLFPRWCREEDWTAGRFILFAGGVMLLIGLASFAFTRQVFVAYGFPLTHLDLSRVMAGTVLIGVFIIATITLANQNRLLRRNTRIGEAANARLGVAGPRDGDAARPSDVAAPQEPGDEAPAGDGGTRPLSATGGRGDEATEAPEKADVVPTDEAAGTALPAPAGPVPAQASPAAPAPLPEVITLVVEDGRKRLRFRSSELVGLSADENYVEVRLQREKEPVVLVRSTLAGLEAQLAAYHPRLFRCHRAHLVNTARIRGVTGNAQGLRLRLEGRDEPVPVSRRYVEEFRRRVLPLL
ncbi:MAG: LytTR family transcriptional regulator [Acidobacteria bacterium]|nr:LytTR family transcriptional regulator [Acidobacteriota bacterium]